MRSPLPLTVFGLLAAGRAAAAGWQLEAFTGAAHSFETTLTVRQEGSRDLRVAADYSTRPFEDAPYYGWRLSREGPRGGWDVQLLHHKLYLEDPPPEVERFEVTHGYNLLTIGHTWRRGGWALRLGLGAVIAHAESTVRARAHGGGYELSGPSAEVALGRRLPLGRRLAVVAEAKLTAARAEVSIGGGQASVPNAALHGVVGLALTL